MKPTPDFHSIEPHQVEIDKRLANWARWCNGGTGGPMTSPMFRMVPPPTRVRADLPTMDKVDAMDAQKVAKGVSALPEKHRGAINWAYVKPTAPHKAAKVLGLSLELLHKTLRDGRQMLLNRNI